MDKGFLDEVVFDKRVRIKRPKKFKQTEESINKKKSVRRKKRFTSKLLRLFYFIATVAVICYASWTSCFGIMSISAGYKVVPSDFSNGD